MDLAVLFSAQTRTPSSHVQLAVHKSGLAVTADKDTHNQAVLWQLPPLACPRCFLRQQQHGSAAGLFELSVCWFACSFACSALCRKELL